MQCIITLSLAKPRMSLAYQKKISLTTLQGLHSTILLHNVGSNAPLFCGLLTPYGQRFLSHKQG